MSSSKRFLQPINLLNLDSDISSASSASGDVYYNSSTSTIRYFDGTDWVTLKTGSGIIISETAPSTPEEGQGWFKSSTSELFFWDGTYWVQATSLLTQLFYVSDTAPSDPITGSGWLNTTNDFFYVFDGTNWINAALANGLTALVEDVTPQLGGDLDGNGFGIDNIDYVDFDTTTTSTPTEGALVWDDGEGTLQLGLKGGNVNLALGQEMVVLCYNGSGSPMSDGDVVYVQGAQGQRPNITLASAASEAGSSKTLGIVTEPIAAGEEGFVTTFGVVNNVNTLGFTEGAALWLSTTAGEYTQTQPQSPNHLVFIGYCLNASETAGRIFVEPQNGYELEELHNVLITSAADEDIIAYDAATGLWKNIPVPISLPDQTGHSGEYLTTDGTNASWSAIDLSAYQPLDADLTAIAGVTGTSGFLKKTAADTWSLDTNTYLTGNQTITLTGDVSGSGTTSISVTVADDSHNHVISNVDGLQTALDAKAPLASPALTGTPTAPTAAAGTNTTQIATTAFVQTSVSNLINGAPGALDTLDELAAALGDDANFATTITNSLATKQPLDADLTAIAGLAGTSGFLKKTAADTWALDTNTYLTGNQTITLTGDVSGSGTTSISVTVDDDSHNHIISNVDGLQAALDAKATDTSVVHIAGTETITGAKTFSATTTFSGNVNINGILDLTNTGVISALDMSNNSIIGVNTFSFADPGAGEGITWAGGNGWYIYESPDNLTNAAGNLQIVQNSTRRATFKTDGTFEVVGNISATGATLSGLTVNGPIYGQNSTGSGDVLVVGNDSKISDIDAANTLGIIGLQSSTQGYIRFGSSGGTFGYNGTIFTSNKDVSITGTLTATAKSFDIQHPTKENMRLRYGSLEGPENGVYVRGKSSSSEITLPDYWTGLVDEDSITVQVTPIGKHRNLYVKDISNNTVTIGGVKRGTEFFYFIQAERKDIDKLVVEYGD